MTEYEAKCSQTWAWYQCYVVDFSIEDDTFHVTYPDDWKKDEWINVSWVRQKYDLTQLSTWIPSENEEAECKARAEIHEPYGWWEVTIKKILNKQLMHISFDGWGDEHNETLEIEYLRKKLTCKTFTKWIIEQEFVSVPKPLKKCIVTHEDNNTLLKTLIPCENISPHIIHIKHIKWWETVHKLRIIGMGNVLNIITDIIDLFFRMLMEKQQFEFTAKDMLGFTDHLTELMTVGYIRNIQNLLSFNIPLDLIKLTLSYVDNYYMMMLCNEWEENDDIDYGSEYDEYSESEEIQWQENDVERTKSLYLLWRKHYRKYYRQLYKAVKQREKAKVVRSHKVYKNNNKLKYHRW